MKIALVAQRYGGTGGGIERVVEELAKRFCREHEVHVYAQSIVRDEICPLHFHRIPRFEHSWSVNQMLFFFLSYLYLTKQRYDIVHLHALSLYRKGIVTCHSIPPRGFLAFWRLRSKLREMKITLKQVRRFIVTRPIAEYNFKRGRHKRVIAISSKIARDLVSICETPPENISFIPNGVDVQRFKAVPRSKARRQIQKRFGLSQDHFIFLFLGNFFKIKGVQFLLPAFARLRDLSARLMIVGNYGGQNQWAKEMAEELRIDERVIFVGEQGDVETFYAASDAFVFPSLYESFGLVLVEALASGLPVIASRTGIAENLIRDGDNGFLLSSVMDLDELSQKMEALLLDRALGRRMGRRARKTANLYSWDQIAEETLAIYRQVMGMEK